MWAHLVFEVISWVFWLCGFAAAAATAAAGTLLYSTLTGTYYSKWATTAAAAGLGAIVWYVHPLNKNHPAIVDRLTPCV